MTVAESHTKREQKHYTHIVPADTGGRSAMARASDTRPFKPYVYNGGEKEPPAVTAARDRHQEISAGITIAQAGLARADMRLTEEVMPDLAPDWQTYRELGDD